MIVVVLLFTAAEEAAFMLAKLRLPLPPLEVAPKIWACSFRDCGGHLLRFQSIFLQHQYRTAMIEAVVGGVKRTSLPIENTLRRKSKNVSNY